MNLIMKDQHKNPGKTVKNIDLLSQEDQYTRKGKLTTTLLVVMLLIMGLFSHFKTANADNDLHNLVSADLISYLSTHPGQKITRYDVE
jgi:hypothetical protein